MFVKVTDNPLPKLYPEVVRKDPTLSDPGFVEIGGFRLRDDIDIAPQSGIQEDIIRCESDVIFAAGAATMGKTFAIMLDSLRGVGRPGYTGVIISKRLLDSGKGSSIFRDFKTIYNGFAGFSVTMTSGIPVAYSEIYENSIRLLHSNYNMDNPSERSEFMETAKKIQASFISSDETTALDFFQWSYYMSRNRDSSGMRPRYLATFNPEYEHWTRDFIDWYIDPDTQFVINERLGVERYFYLGDAKSAKEVIWGNTKEEVLSKIDIPLSKKDKALGLKQEDMVKSFTFFSGEAADNKILVNRTGGGSISNLLNSGDGKRLKSGFFGPVDDENSNISSRIIRKIFSNPVDNSTTMYATMDVSGGSAKGDLCLIGIWRGLTLIHVEQNFITNDPTAVKVWVKEVLEHWGVSVYNFAFDANTIGYFLREFKNGIAVMLQSRQMIEYDQHGNQSKSGEYRTLRSQLLAKTEALILTGDISCEIDKDKKFIHGKNKAHRTLEDILIDEKDVFKYSIVDKRIYYKSKTEFQKKYKFSPDFIDVIMLRAIFELDARPRKEEEEEFTCDDYYF